LPKQKTTIIYLGNTSLHRSICLPASIGRAALNRLPIGHFSTQGLPLPYVAILQRALLPHIFTLTIEQALRRLFSVVLAITFSGIHPLGGALLCAVRTFLPMINTWR